ncbi:MAG: hypothetical protein AAGA85_20235 [Bacteroidota bacterium]
MEKYRLNQQLITQLNDDFKSEELPVVVECAQKVANHLERNIANNRTASHRQTLSDRQVFVQEIIKYCAISGI